MVHMKLEEPFASDGTETAGNAGAQAGVHSEWAQWLREVARGERGARDLTFEQARAAVRSLLHGRATDAQVGAFLAAERMKGESVDELAGFVSELAEVVRDDVLLAELRRRLGPGALDCAGPYDGRAHSFAATVAAAAVLAAAGVPVFLHAPDPLPPKRGVSLKETVRCLDIGSASEWETGVIWRHRFAFVDTEAVHPGLRRLRRVREELGFRTWLNTAEKFLNLASAAYLVAGVFHGAALTKAAALAQRLPYRRCLIVQGVDGSEDLPVHREAAVAWVESGEVRELRINPRQLGLAADSPPARLTAAEQAAAVESVLSGQTGPYRHMTLLNAGVRMWLTGRVESLAEGVALAQELVDSGEARTVLDGWRRPEAVPGGGRNGL